MSRSSATDNRPPRKAIPVSVKQAVVERQHGICTCGCGRTVEVKKHLLTTRYDHQPALEFRAVNEARTDYTPPQLDPDHIIARCVASDRKKTSGKLHTSVGSDAHMAGKIRTIRGENKQKQKRPWPKGRKMGERYVSNTKQLDEDYIDPRLT